MIRLALLLLPLLALPGCKREQRTARPDVVATEQPARTAPRDLGVQYEQSAFQVSEGKRLFTWFNCVGCHANGGGGSGPALMDDSWLYGGSLREIAATITEGRPNGMPAFGGRVPEEQIWQLAAYVRSMSAQVSSGVAPARNDDMHPRPAENRLPSPPPRGPSP